MYKKSKSTLKCYIMIEAIITIAMFMEHNYYAAAGWGFLLLTNLGILVEMSEETSEDTKKETDGDSGKVV